MYWMCCQLLLDDDSLCVITADFDGPAGTPFESGRFRVRLSLPHDFPASPPKGYFTTKIFHPNVSAAGEICVNTLKKDWQPSHGLRHVLLVLRCLLIQPNPESALNEEAGRLLMEDYSEYDRRARLMTRLHATSGRKAAAGSSTGSAGSPLKAHKEDGGQQLGKGERETKGEAAADDEEAGGQENAQLHANSPTNAKRPQGAEPLKSASTAVNPSAELAEAKKKPSTAAAVSKPADKPKAIKKSIKRL